MRQFFRGIRNLIECAPLVWRDRNFDHSFLLRLLEFKLRRMEKLFREDGCHVGSNDDAKNMKLCADAISRIIADDYCVDENAAFLEKWGYRVRVRHDCS